MRGVRGSRLLMGFSAALATAAGLLLLRFPAPHLTLENTSLVIRYAAAPGWGLLVSAVGLGLAAAFSPRPWIRACLAFTAFALLALGAQKIAFRLDVGAESLSLRGLFGRTTLRWAEVSRVDSGLSAVVVRGQGDAQVRVETGSFTEDQRATLDRTIARHVRESREGGGLR
jgi:hypothetical protein